MDIALREWKNTPLHLWGVLNVKDMATPERSAEDISHMEDVVKKTQSKSRKIAQIKVNTQTVKKNTHFHKILWHIQKREGNTGSTE